MIKLLAFDMDGVLCDCVHLHKYALDQALLEIAGPGYSLSEEDVVLLNGLPTRTKLSILSESKGLPLKLHRNIEDLKQKLTIEMVDVTIGYDATLVRTMKNLKSSGYTLACVSNSVPESISKILYRLGVMVHMDFIVSNKTTIFNKPSPSPYLWACSRANVSTWEALVFEDSDKGMQSCIRAGCNLCRVDSPYHLTEDFIRKAISLYD